MNKKLFFCVALGSLSLLVTSKCADRVLLSNEQSVAESFSSFQSEIAESKFSLNVEKIKKLPFPQQAEIASILKNPFFLNKIKNFSEHSPRVTSFSDWKVHMESLYNFFESFSRSLESSYVPPKRVFEICKVILQFKGSNADLLKLAARIWHLAYNTDPTNKSGKCKKSRVRKAHFSSGKEMLLEDEEAAQVLLSLNQNVRLTMPPLMFLPNWQYDAVNYEWVWVPVNCSPLNQDGTRLYKNPFSDPVMIPKATLESDSEDI